MVYTSMYHEYQRDIQEPDGGILENPATSAETAVYKGLRDFLKQAEELQKFKRLVDALDGDTSELLEELEAALDQQSAVTAAADMTTDALRTCSLATGVLTQVHCMLTDEQNILELQGKLDGAPVAAEAKKWHCFLCAYTNDLAEGTTYGGFPRELRSETETPAVAQIVVKPIPHDVKPLRERTPAEVESDRSR